MGPLFHGMGWDRTRTGALSCGMGPDLYEMGAPGPAASLDMNLFTHLYYRSLSFLKSRVALCGWHQFTWFLVSDALVALADFVCVMWATIVLLNCAASNFPEMPTHFFKEIVAELVDLRRHLWRACEGKSRLCGSFKENRIEIASKQYIYRKSVEWTDQKLTDNSDQVSQYTHVEKNLLKSSHQNMILWNWNLV